MRLVILASALLLATAAGAQNTPAVPASGQQSVAPPMILSQGSGDVCLAIRTIHGRRTERVPMLTPPGPQGQYSVPRPTVSTCTPANRFRAMYIPNATLHRDTLPAQCPDCGTPPRDHVAPELQQVRQPQ